MVCWLSPAISNYRNTFEHELAFCGGWTLQYAKVLLPFSTSGNLRICKCNCSGIGGYNKKSDCYQLLSHTLPSAPLPHIWASGWENLSAPSADVRGRFKPGKALPACRNPVPSPTSTTGNTRISFPYSLTHSGPPWLPALLSLETSYCGHNYTFHTLLVCVWHHQCYD